jgi:serine/threonine protein phosphatase PrpC
MVDDGTIERRQAASHPLRNRVFSCLGGGPPQIESFAAGPLRDGDLIALCTDGCASPAISRITPKARC